MLYFEKAKYTSLMHYLPLVTVICSCYNHEDYVTQTLDSVINQTYTNIELIVVDDFSKDNSSLVIQKWIEDHPKVKFIQNKENLFLTKSFNNAVKQSKGEYLIDLAADDLLKPDCIEKQIHVFLTSSKKNLGLVFGNAEEIDPYNNFIKQFFTTHFITKIKKAIDEGFYYYLLSDSSYICSVSGMYKRSIFESLEGYDEDLFFEDFDYWLRVCKKFELEFTDSVLVSKRALETSMGNGFFKKTETTTHLHESFYVILKKCYRTNTQKKEYVALLKRIYKQSRWAIKTFNIKYIFRYFIFTLKTLIKLL